VRLKLEAMSVVEHGDAFFGERFARFVEDGGGFAALGLVEAVLVIDPRAAGELDAERLGVLHHVVEVVLVAVIREVAADGLQAALFELGFELLGAEVVGAGEFDLLDAKLLHAVERPWHAAQRELAAQAVELQTGGVRRISGLDLESESKGEEESGEFHGDEGKVETRIFWLVMAIEQCF
jgi:hypothetical protein